MANGKTFCYWHVFLVHLLVGPGYLMRQASIGSQVRLVAGDTSFLCSYNSVCHRPGVRWGEERLCSRALAVQLVLRYIMRQAPVEEKQGFFSRVHFDGEYTFLGATSITYSGAGKWRVVRPDGVYNLIGSVASTQPRCFPCV